MEGFSLLRSCETKREKWKWMCVCVCGSGSGGGGGDDGMQKYGAGTGKKANMHMRTHVSTRDFSTLFLLVAGWEYMQTLLELLMSSKRTCVTRCSGGE